MPGRPSGQPGSVLKSQQILAQAPGRAEAGAIRRNDGIAGSAARGRLAPHHVAE